MTPPAPQLTLAFPAAPRPEERRRKGRKARPDAAQAARDEALTRVEENAAPGWVDRVYDLAVEIARRQETFSGDDLWEAIEAAGLADATHERRAVGAVMNKIARNRIAVNTYTVIKSKRKSVHAQPQAVWRSLVYEGGKGQ